jgi:hypothetical protein
MRRNTDRPPDAKAGHRLRWGNGRFPAQGPALPAGRQIAPVQLPLLQSLSLPPKPVQH